ncbi:MerR family transcriptional regulator [Paraoerskovia sediminicola]|uniref:MerR family transcriptional regulator n=1 Tax=Paraoerskovia sediminicola TaxID=1138587 RepID=A0ABN6XE77_9CELL|nr:MerR family transcriptional regulator [Paraoerskovia sediminicola]BDZ42423.1 MerR family transcriptional regulator [Paraoerskovia sediminicola]
MGDSSGDSSVVGPREVPAAQVMQIGEVAERTGLSLRSIRYYEEVGLVLPSARSHGGYRLYTPADLQRFGVVMGMKPLGFSLEEMRDLLGALDALEQESDGAARDALLARLAEFHARADERCASLRRKLGTAEALSERLGGLLDEHGPV